LELLAAKKLLELQRDGRRAIVANYHCGSQATSRRATSVTGKMDDLYDE